MLQPQCLRGTLIFTNIVNAFAGDIHGQFSDLVRIFTEVCGLPGKDGTKFLFLGYRPHIQRRISTDFSSCSDYVDRGKQSLESIFTLLAFKVLLPDQIFLLRGNHECSSINRVYGFYDECKRRYSLGIWKNFILCFNWLPIACLVSDRILCMHGGLSPDLVKV